MFSNYSQKRWQNSFKSLWNAQNVPKYPFFGQFCESKKSKKLVENNRFFRFFGKSIKSIFSIRFPALFQTLKAENTAHQKYIETRKIKNLTYSMRMYRVSHRTLPLEFFLNFYGMLKDMNLKISTDDLQDLSYTRNKAWNICRKFRIVCSRS